MPAAMTTRTGLFMFISSLKRVFFFFYGFIILQITPGNKTKLFLKLDKFLLHISASKYCLLLPDRV